MDSKFEPLTEEDRIRYRNEARELLAPEGVLSRIMNDIKLNCTETMSVASQESADFRDALSILRGIQQIEGALKNVDTDRFRQKGYFRRLTRRTPA